MTSYKKRFISLAAAMVLSSGLSADGASYIPLTSSANDNQWVMFGVNGFKIDGATADATANFANYGAVADTQITDNTVDQTAVAGLRATTNDATTNMGKIKVLNLSSGALSSITINVDSLSETYSATEPMRTMYIRAGGNDYADAMFTYKASLEGKTLEFQIDGSNSKTYTTTISASNTFDNPAIRTEKVASSGNGGSPLNTIPLAIDYDFSDNPQNPNNYNRISNADNSASNQTANAGAKARFYGYNAKVAKWEIYDIGNTELANDFTELKRGKAYWGKLDLGATITKSGLVLGTSGLTKSDYENSLAPGWNLISFDDNKPIIRTSSTGMIITDELNGTNPIKIIDSTGFNEISLKLPAVNPQGDAIAINLAVEAAKSNGTFVDAFDLRAFEVNTTAILLISNKRFGVNDINGSEIGGAFTMAGHKLWNETNSTLADYNTTFPTNTVVSSVYGESALIFKPIIAGGASQLDHVALGGGTATSAKIQVKDNTAVSMAVGTDAVGSLTYTVTNLKSDSTIDNATTVDIDNNGTADYIIVAADEPFYIRDHTFTRVMTYDPDGHGDTFKIFSPTHGTITTAATIGDTVDKINAIADANTDTDTKVYAAATNTNDIVFVTSEENANNFNIIDNVDEDYLSDTTSSADIAKGAIKDVYSIDYLAKQAIVPHNVEINIAQVTDNSGDTVQFGLNGGAVDANASTGAVAATAVAYKAMFDAYVAQIKTQIKAAGIDGVVTHDFTETDDANIAAALAAAKITIKGYGVSSAFVGYASGGGSTENNITGADTSTNPGTLDTPIADLTPDLKYNAIYTPDYAKEGPLYTLKDLGYTPQAIVTGNTNLALNQITWDSIDLTRTPKEWFKNSDGTIHNDYNLFNIDGKVGYWVYLIDNPDTNNIAISHTDIKSTYTSHFNLDGTTKNFVRTSVGVTVTGLTPSPAVNVYANVGGSNVQLTTSSTNGVYSGNLSSYEVQGLDPVANRDISITISDGMGYKYSSIDQNVTIGSIDYEKPATPTITLGNGTNVQINSTSVDTTGYYLYKGNIPEEGTKNASIKKLLASEASSFNLCTLPSSSFSANNNYKVFAIDGLAANTGATSDGEFGYGNASDVLSFDFSVPLKGSRLLTNTEGIDTDASSLGAVYDDSCTATGSTDQTNAGVSVKSIITDKPVKMSFVKLENVEFTNNLPLTIYVGTSSTGLAEIKYMPAYGGKTFYVQFEDDQGVPTLYTGTFPTDDTTNGTSSSALILTQVNNQTF